MNAASAASTNGLSPATFLRSLVNHRDLRSVIANDTYNHPESDVRQRFLSARYLRAQWIEWKVGQKEREVLGMMEDIRTNKLDEDDAQCQADMFQALHELDTLVAQSSRAFQMDSKAALAPVVDEYFMNHVFREGLQESLVPRAPNGELNSFYGSKWEPISPRFAAIRGKDDNFFRHHILNKLVIPFNHRVYVPCRRFFDWLLCRPSIDSEQGLTDSTLETIVSGLESMLAVLLVAGSVALVYNIPSTKNRLIATTFLSLPFIYLVPFLSTEAGRIFQLTAAFWAVVIVTVFVSTTNSGGRAA